MNLRTRILALGVGSAAAMLLLLAVPVTLAVQGNVRDDAQQWAASVASGVADLVSTDRTSDNDLAAVVDRIGDRTGDPVTVRFDDGSTLGEDLAGCVVDGGGFEALDGSGALAPPRGDGDRDGDDRPGRPGVGSVSDATVAADGGDRIVRVVAQRDGEPVAVCVAVDGGAVRTEVLERVGVLGLAGLATLVAVAVLAVVVGRRLARHLTATATTADRLAEGDLSARAPEDGPQEVRVVGAALNRLAGRIDELLTLERETAADLSHRLRTPVTVLRLDVEAMPESSHRRDLEDHLDHLERTLTAVIQAARRPQREGAAPHADARQVVVERFEYWAPLLEDQGREARLDAAAHDALPVRCAPEDLAAALDALLENAIAHTEEGIGVAVVVEGRDDGLVVVEIRDRGPGVPPAALRRGTSDRGSTGLGLDVARSCAEASGGRLELDRHDGWSVVRLVLGPA